MSYVLHIGDLGRFGLASSGRHGAVEARVTVTPVVEERTAVVVCACGVLSSVSGSKAAETYFDLLWWAWNTGPCVMATLAL